MKTFDEELLEVEERNTEESRKVKRQKRRIKENIEKEYNKRLKDAERIIHGY